METDSCNHFAADSYLLIVAATPFSGHVEAPLQHLHSSSGSFGHVNYSELILLAPKSTYNFSGVTNTCLNHIRDTALYAPCNNTFNYD